MAYEQSLTTTNTQTEMPAGKYNGVLDICETNNTLGTQIIIIIIVIIVIIIVVITVLFIVTTITNIL